MFGEFCGKDARIEQRITVSTFNIDVSTLPHGVYVIKVVGNKGLQVGKFLK